MGFPRQEYWRGLPFPITGDLPDQGMEPMSPAWQADSLSLSYQGSLYFLGLQNYCYCSHEIKRCLLLERKVVTKLDSTLKSRDFTLPTKVHLVKVMVFPVVMYGCESWTIKKAEQQRIDAFELWCWRRLLRVLGLQGDHTRQS